MKILWIYSFDPLYDWDNFLHMKYVQYLSTHPGLEVVAYGPRMHEGYGELTKLEYDKNILLKDIQVEFKFDVVIANTKSRMFGYYSPFTKRAEEYWVPEDFKNYDVPKVMIEEDYHYEPDDTWYKEAGFDVVFQRHYRNWLRAINEKPNLPQVWLPFSVDTDTFKPDPKIDRIKKLCLAASSTPQVYVCRRGAFETLSAFGLAEGFTTQHWKGSSYIRCLQSYISHICCSSIYHVTPAKIFEIMASGSILFTNQGKYGLQHLFPQDAYVSYKEDLTNTQEMANKIIHDSVFRDHTVKTARNTILSRHTHYIRTTELLNAIRRECDL